MSFLKELEVLAVKQSPKIVKQSPKIVKQSPKIVKQSNVSMMLKGDKSLSKAEMVEYIISILKEKKENYPLDYLRALKFNLDAINIIKLKRGK